MVEAVGRRDRDDRRLAHVRCMRRVNEQNAVGVRSSVKVVYVIVSGFSGCVVPVMSWTFAIFVRVGWPVTNWPKVV